MLPVKVTEMKCIISMFASVYSKDVRLPVQLQRAMAAEAEASREARAKVSTGQRLDPGSLGQVVCGSKSHLDLPKNIGSINWSHLVGALVCKW